MASELPAVPKWAWAVFGYFVLLSFRDSLLEGSKAASKPEDSAAAPPAAAVSSWSQSPAQMFQEESKRTNKVLCRFCTS